MADERYQKLLGIEPTDEIPTYYELLNVDRNERDDQVVEKAYKTQIRKLQEIRTSKDKGFLEFLKEELRKARRTLTNGDLRKAYDESLLADTIESFKQFVQPLMALGSISKSVFDTMVSKGVSDGLAEDKAKQVIEELAKAHDATLELEEPAPAAAPAAAPVQADDEEPAFVDDLEDSRGREVVLKAPPGAGAPSSLRDRANRFYGPGGSAGTAAPTDGAAEPPGARGPWARTRAPAASPWGRGSGRSGGVPWGQSQRTQRPRPGAGRTNEQRAYSAGGAESTQGQRDRWMSQQERRQYDEAVRIFNLGAKLSKIANDVHEKLRMYFPPANGKSSRTYQINGVSYEKVFDTEQKTYRDTLKKFEDAQRRLDGLSTPDAEAVRARAQQNVALIKGYLDEIRQHKLRQLAGLSQSAELRAWQEFVGSTRSSRLCQMIEE